MAIDIDNMVEDHEHRLVKMEVENARLSERIDALVKSVGRLNWALWGITITLLLTVVYGAIGERGFNQVTNPSRSPIGYPAEKGD